MSGLQVAVTGKQFGAAPEQADIAFELMAGERAALIGPSGVGKTTLLSLTAGLDAAFGGQITRPPGALAMVFQTPIYCLGGRSPRTSPRPIWRARRRAGQAAMVDVLDRRGATCLIATHDHGQAPAVADHLLELGGSPALLVSDRRSPFSRQQRSDPCALADLQAR